MRDFSRANVVRNIQKIQDELAGLADTSLTLVDSQGRELTIPSRLPAHCMKFESSPECKHEISNLIKGASGNQVYLHRCHCLLYGFSFKTAYRINMESVYLIGGRTESHEKLKKHLALIVSVFSLPVNAGVGKKRVPEQDNSKQGLLSSLTPQELKILALIGQGMSNKSIASEMFISPNTVKVHVSRLLHKLNLNNRTDAALLATNPHLFLEKE